MAKKRRRNRGRTRSGPDAGDAVPDVSNDGAAVDGDGVADTALPSMGARIAGVVLALVTLGIAVGTIATGFSEDRAAIDVGLRLLAGLLLIALAIVIGALAIVPRVVRRVIWGV